MKGKELKAILNGFTATLNGGNRVKRERGEDLGIEEGLAKIAGVVENAADRSLLGRRGELGAARLDTGDRDLDADCGYPNGNPTIEQYKAMYDEEGIAARLVGCLPSECWGVYPEVYEREDSRVTEWERAYKKLNDRIPIMSYLHRLDRVSRIAHYGVMLYGFNDTSNLEKPVRKGKKLKLLYLRPYQEYYAPIVKFSQAKSARNGWPEFYDLSMATNQNAGIGREGSTIMGSPLEGMRKVKVHYSRILHVADNRDDNEISGVPVMRPLFRRLLDLRKVYASSAEMYFQGAFPGFSFETHPDLADEAELDIESIIEVLQNYQDHLSRYLASTGGVFKSLAPQVSDPTPQIMCYISAICAVLGIPIRIFMGSEAGQLASTQDAKTFNHRIAERQRLHCEPNILRPFLFDMQKYGVLPEPKEEIKVSWKDLNTISDKERADVSVAYSQVLMQYLTSGAEKVLPLEWLYQTLLNMPQTQSDAVMAKVLAMKDSKDYITKDLWTATQTMAKIAAAGQRAAGGGKTKKQQNQTKAGAASRSRRSKAKAA